MSITISSMQILRRTAERQPGAVEVQGELQKFEHQLQAYAELLLTDADGLPREARAEHILSGSVEAGDHRSAQAVFYRDESGGFIVDEYRNGSSDLLFQSFARPNPDYDPSDPGSHEWDTGMLRMKWMRFSEYDKDNLEPVIGVIKAFFGGIPKDRL